jgi:large subunit ribosomal protein L22
MCGIIKPVMFTEEKLMEAKAVRKYVRISPMKVSIVLDLIRNKPVAQAKAILKATPKAASYDVLKVLDSAVANAENNFQMNKDALYVKTALVGPAPTMKRIQPRSRGSAYPILKRSSHITVVVAEKE